MMTGPSTRKNRPRKLVYLYQSVTYTLIQTEKRYSLETAHLKNIHVDRRLGRPPTLLLSKISTTFINETAQTATPVNMGRAELDLNCSCIRLRAF